MATAKRKPVQTAITKAKAAPLRASKSKYAPRPSEAIDVAIVARVPNPGQRFAQMLPSDPWVTASTLQLATTGDLESYLELANSMEEKYLHYSSVVATRKMTVTGCPVDLLPGDETPYADQIANLCRKLVIETPAFEALSFDLLSAITHGYSAVQPHWDLTGPVWTYREFEPIDQRLFVYDRPTLSQLRLRQEGTPDGIEIPAGQFIIHRPKLRTGVPVRAGIARAAAVGYLFHTQTVKQWATMIEVWGMPIRLGTYEPGAATTEDEINQLRTALINLGHDAAAMVPSTMKLEVLDARRPSSGENIYKEFAEYWDRQISKLVLGQTMTTDDGSSMSQAKVHNEVRLDLMAADCKALNATLNEQLIKPWVAYNFGPTAPCPRIRFSYEPAEDLKSYAEALTPFIAQGLRVKASQIRGKFGLEEPEPGEECLTQALSPITRPSEPVDDDPAV